MDQIISTISGKKGINKPSSGQLIKYMQYWLIDACFFALSLFLGLSSVLNDDCSGLIWAVTINWTYPLLLESAFNFISTLQRPLVVSTLASSRFVYHPSYNISLWGLQKNHLFDGHRYQKVYDLIVEKGLLKRGTEVRPQIITRKFLLEKMSPTYLKSLCYGVQVARLVELEQFWLPAWLLRWRILDPMLLACQGSIAAACLALELGWAVNLSGGFHHASYSEGGGFCIYPDISMVVHYLQSRLMIHKIMIIDLDAHQGNGFQRDLILNDDVYIIDCYNSLIFKDTESEDAITRRLHVNNKTTNEEYLRMIDSFRQDFNFCQPELVIYNAGSDILEKDPLGGMCLSSETLVSRDEKVVGMCRERGIPVVMLLSGGYQQSNAEVIADSLANLVSKWGLSDQTNASLES